MEEIEKLEEEEEEREGERKKEEEDKDSVFFPLNLMSPLLPDCRKQFYRPATVGGGASGCWGRGSVFAPVTGVS